MLEFVYKVVTENEFFAGAAVLALTAAVLAPFRKLPKQVWLRLRGQFMVTVDLRNDDESFQWVRAWLAQHSYNRRNRLLSVVVSRERDPDDRLRPVLFPAPGWHFFLFRGRLLWLWYGREETQNHTYLYRETFYIRIFGRSPEVARHLIEEARDAALPRADGKIGVYVPRDSQWWQVRRFTARPVSSVILPDGMIEDVLDDMSIFLAEKDWYHDAGIPFRRGYLFHGPPGNGKTSVITALAGVLKLNIYFLDLSGSVPSDDALRELVGRLPESCLVLIEDVDGLFHRREPAGRTGVTFSGLLNTLDGVMSSEGRILCLTTNHRDRVDPALLRPGRVDREFELPNPDARQAARLFRRFFADATDDEAAAFGARASRSAASMATLQAWLLRRKGRKADALAGLSELCDTRAESAEERESAPGQAVGLSKVVSR